jgi:hypothetical protein
MSAIQQPFSLLPIGASMTEFTNNPLHEPATVNDLLTLSNAIDTNFNRVDHEFVRVHEQLSMLRNDMNQLGSGLGTEMRELGVELRTDMQELKTELRTDMREFKFEIKEMLATMFMRYLLLNIAFLSLVTTIFGVVVAIFR